MLTLPHGVNAVDLPSYGPVSILDWSALPDPHITISDGEYTSNNGLSIHGACPGIANRTMESGSCHTTIYHRHSIVQQHSIDHIDGQHNLWNTCATRIPGSGRLTAIMFGSMAYGINYSLRQVK